MMNESTEHDIEESKFGLSRRGVLKAAGTTAAVGALGIGAVGSASAHDVTEIVFCGCSQVCACGTGWADVLVAVEDGDGFEFTWIRNVDFNFCVSIDDPGVPDGKIIAVQANGTRWINPNQCAQKALAAEQEQLPSTHPRPEGDSGGPCGKPPCEHPARGPPEDRGRSENGPPTDQGNGPP